MSLAFLVPLFLAGLAALAVPVVIHLLNRERKEVIRFPSLMFLERIAYRAIRRQSIRHPLLLALRALALLLLVLAFARPFFERSTDGLAAAGGTERVILLDRSYSMGLGDRWDRALAAVRSELASAAPGDRVTLVAFDDRATVLPGSAPGDFGPALDSLAPGHRTTRVGPALATAREVLSGSRLARREVVIVSDLQRGAWDGRGEGRLPANVPARVIAVGDSGHANAMVARVQTDREIQGNQVTGSVVALLRNQGSRVLARRVTLEVQGREVEQRTVELPPQGAATVRFSPLPIPPRPAEARVRLEPDDLAADDVMHFALSRDQSLSVLVLGRPAGNRGVFLRHALALGDDPPFVVSYAAAESVDPAQVQRAAVIVLNNTPFPGGARGTQLAARVRAGAGLVVILGESGDPSRWSETGRALLPAAVTGLVDRTADRGGRLTSLERSHPVFQPFAGPRSGDFTATRFLRYRRMEPGDSADAIAWFDDGNVALVSGRAGAGRVLAWASTLDDFWNDLVLQPVFLPMLHSMVRHAAGFTPDPLWRTVGERVTLAASPDSSSRATLVDPSGARVRGGDAPLELATPGFYQVEGEPGETARMVAVNVDRNESDLNTWNPAEFQAAITSGDTLAVLASSDAMGPAEREGRQRVWWFLLLGALAALLAELLLANYLSRRAPAPASASVRPAARGAP